MTSKPESRGRLSESIADALQHEILRDGFVSDRRLPTEAELTERFGVSRTVVREAARLLVQRGLVTVKPGRGMVVAHFDGAHIAEQFSLLLLASDGTFEQLLELRLVLEVQVATAAARNMTQPVLAQLEATIAAGQALIDAPGPVDSALFLDADMNFHETLAAASGNPFFDLVGRPINTFLRTHYLHRDGYPSDPVRTLDEHREILSALRRGDTFGARQATEEHLRRLLRKWRPETHPGSAPSVRILNKQNVAAEMAATEPSTNQET